MARKRTAAKTSTINRTTPTSSSLLERYCRGLAARVDGERKRSAGGRKVGGVLPAFSGGFSGFGAVAQKHSEARRPRVGLGRGNHPRPERRPFPKKETHRADSGRQNR